MKRSLPLVERLRQSFFENKEGCHEWNKAISKKGYGVIGIGSRVNKSRKTILAHRLSWELYNVKSIPKDLCVLHKCDNRRCINPLHLFLGTPKDNTQDMIIKNRGANKKGVVPNNFVKQVERVKKGQFSKLTAIQVKEIKKFLEVGINYRIIADQYNVSASCISDIKRKATWIDI